MNCKSPTLIYNSYIGERMYVPCRKCNACRISSANEKALLLYNEMQKDWFVIFATLTYNTANLPVVFYNDTVIRRYGDGSLQPILRYKSTGIVERLNKPFDINPIVPYNYPCIDCTGVLYYKDFQNFMKRFRINLVRNGYKEHIKFFSIGELGTNHKRPHWHVLLFFKSNPRNKGIRVDELICKSWTMCDETVTRSGIKVADSLTSFYLASYVNGSLGSLSFDEFRCFRQKTHRSAYLDFGCAKKDKEVMCEALRHGIYQYSSERNISPFEYFDSTKKDNVSVVCISQRVFSTYFSKPFRFRSLSPFGFRIRARIIRKFYTGTFGTKHLCQSDLSFYRSYKRYLSLMNYDDSNYRFEEYLDVFLRAYSLYQSVLLKRRMLEYDENNPIEYLEDSINTFNSSKDFWNRQFLIFGYNDDLEFHFQSLTTQHKIDDYIFKYKKNLLPKHINSFYKPLFF